MPLDDTMGCYFRLHNLNRVFVVIYHLFLDLVRKFVNRTPPTPKNIYIYIEACNLRLPPRPFQLLSVCCTMKWQQHLVPLSFSLLKCCKNRRVLERKASLHAIC